MSYFLHMNHRHHSYDRSFVQVMGFLCGTLVCDLGVAPRPQEHDRPYGVFRPVTSLPSLDLLRDGVTVLVVRSGVGYHGGLVRLLQPLPHGPLCFMRQRGITRRVERLHALRELGGFVKEKILDLTIRIRRVYIDIHMIKKVHWTIKWWEGPTSTVGDKWRILPANIRDVSLFFFLYVNNIHFNYIILII